MVGVLGLLVAAHGALRAMAVELVPVAVTADAVPAATLLGLPREGACRYQPGDWDGQDVPEAWVRALGQLSILLCLGHISFPISFL